MASAGRVVICLFRNDLRYLDNEVLQWSSRNADFLLPLYCFDPRHYKGTYHFNMPKTGPHQVKFLQESVINLKATLKEHGSGLILRRGKPETVVSEIIQQLGKDNVSAITFQQEVTEEELDVEAALKKECGVNIKSFWGSTMYHKDDVPFASMKQVPDVYTEFRKRVESQCRVRPVCEMPDQLKPLPPGIDEGEVPSYEELSSKEPAGEERTAFPFSGGETAALERLNHYFWDTDSVAKYKETRNGMIGPDYSTKFSPWLAHGCITPRSIYWKVKQYEKERTANQSTYWVLFELIWRDYFKFVGLKYGNKLFHRSGILGNKNMKWKQDMNLFNAWKEGRTGVPYVDANMRELSATGFMSNRGRQNVASFLTKNLELDWRMGAEWFESMLIDHDVCSNYGNWQYSAGIGNDPRENRKFNQIKQGYDYDPDGDYVRLWVPELKDIKGGDAHIPWTLGKGLLHRAGVSIGETYPHPVVVSPEWNKHMHRGGSARGRGSAGPPQKRGVDFYFKQGPR